LRAVANGCQSENRLSQSFIPCSNKMTTVFTLKLWPQKKWKKILLVSVLIVVVVFASVLAYIIFAINNDIVTDIVVKNAGGSDTALVLYHPGLSSFAHDVAYAFADGLVSSGWRVEIATPSAEAPTDMSNYGLLVLCFSTYGGNPDAPTVRHLERMGDLQGIQTVLVGLAAGDAGSSTATMQKAVTNANGTVILEKAFYTQAPNEGNQPATDLAEQAGRGITL
jgi:hypothetical protein